MTPTSGSQSIPCAGRGYELRTVEKVASIHIESGRFFFGRIPPHLEIEAPPVLAGQSLAGRLRCPVIVKATMTPQPT